MDHGSLTALRCDGRKLGPFSIPPVPDYDALRQGKAGALHSYLNILSGHTSGSTFQGSPSAQVLPLVPSCLLVVVRKARYLRTIPMGPSLPSSENDTGTCLEDDSRHGPQYQEPRTTLPQPQVTLHMGNICHCLPSAAASNLTAFLNRSPCHLPTASVARSLSIPYLCPCCLPSTAKCNTRTNAR